MPADSGRNAVKVEIVGPTDRLTKFVQVVDDRVAALHAKLLEGSSSGVQMIGGFSRGGLILAPAAADCKRRQASERGGGSPSHRHTARSTDAN